MGMLDTLTNIGGMLGGMAPGIAYLQSRKMGGDPIQALAAMQQMSADKQYKQYIQEQRMRAAEEEERRKEAEKRQSNMRESQLAVSSMLSTMTPQQQQAYLRDPAQMAWLAGPDADKGISQAIVQSMAQPAQPLDKNIGNYVDADGYQVETFQKADGTVYNVRVGKAQQQQNPGSAPYFSPIYSAGGVQNFDHRTGAVGKAPGGEGVVAIPGDPEQQARIVQLKEWAKKDQQFESAAQNDAPRLASSAERLRGILDAVTSGDAQTGILVGNVLKLTDPETALLEAESVLQTLEALQMVNLAPVTVKELELLREMFMSANKTKEINTALLRKMVTQSERALTRLQDQYDYFSSPDPFTGMPRNTLRGYVPPSLRRQSPNQAPKLGEISPEQALKQYGNTN